MSAMGRHCNNPDRRDGDTEMISEMIKILAESPYQLRRVARLKHDPGRDCGRTQREGTT
jgi:hypothetical protein